MPSERGKQGQTVITINKKRICVMLHDGVRWHAMLFNVI